METIELIIEKARDGNIWGRVNYLDNLLIDKAKTEQELKKRFKKLLADFEELDPKTYEFQIGYDLSSLFEQKKYLNITAIAEIAGINPSLMRQYASGIKFPSAEKTKAIEKIIHTIGQDLLNVVLQSGRKKKQTSKVQHE